MRADRHPPCCCGCQRSTVEAKRHQSYAFVSLIILLTGGEIVAGCSAWQLPPVLFRPNQRNKYVITMASVSGDDFVPSGRKRRNRDSSDISGGTRGQNSRGGAASNHRRVSTKRKKIQRFNQRLDNMAKTINPRKAEESIAIADDMEKIVFDSLKKWEEGKGESEETIRPETKTFNILINAIGRSAYYDSALRAEKILNKMFELHQNGYEHLAPDSYSFTIVLSSLCRWAKRSNENAEDAARRGMQLLSNMEDMVTEGNEAVKPTAVTYNIVLDILSKTGKIQDVELSEALLERMHRRGCAPSIISYNCCMKAYVRCAARGAKDAPDRAEKLLSQLKDSQCISPDRITYTTLIDCYAKSAATRSGAAQRAEEILRSMIHQCALNKSNVAICPDLLTYSTVIHAWTNSRAPNATARAKSLLLQMEAKHATDPCAEDLAPNTITYNTVLTAIARSGSPDAASEAWEIMSKMQQLSSMKDRDVKCDTYTFSTVINAIAQSGANPFQAEELFFRMHREYELTGDLSFRPNTITLSSVVNAYAQSGRADAAVLGLSFLDKAEKIDYLTPNYVVYSTMLECLAKTRNMGSAKAVQSVLDRMETLYRRGDKEARPDASAYGHLINAYTKSGSADAAQRALDLLADAEEKFRRGNEAMKPTSEAYSLLYSAVLQSLAKSSSVHGAEKAEELLRKKLLFRSRPKMKTIHFNAVIDAWARSGAPDAAERAEGILSEMLRRYQKQGDIEVRPSVRSFNAVCLAWKNSCMGGNINAPKRAESVLKRMNDMYQSTGLCKPDICTINTIIGTWSQVGTKMAAEKAMAFLLYAEGREAVGDRTMIPDGITFRSVIEAWANSGDETALNRMIEVAKRMQASPNKPDLHTLQSLMKCYNVLHYPEKPKISSRCSSKPSAAERQGEMFLKTLLVEHDAGRADADFVKIAFGVLLDLYRQNGKEDCVEDLKQGEKAFLHSITEECPTGHIERNKWHLSRKFREG